jgi:hypothetical protein
LTRLFVEGAGEIAAVGNGNSSTVELFKVDVRRAFCVKPMRQRRMAVAHPAGILLSSGLCE